METTNREWRAPVLLTVAAGIGIAATFLPVRAIRTDLPGAQASTITSTATVDWSFWRLLVAPEDLGLWAQWGLEALDPSARAKGTLLVAVLLMVAAAGAALALTRRRPAAAERARTAARAAVAVLVGAVAVLVVEAFAVARPSAEVEGVRMDTVAIGPGIAVLTAATALAVAGALAARRTAAGASAAQHSAEPVADLATPPMGIRRIE